VKEVWRHHYLSTHIRKFGSSGFGFIGTFLVVEAAFRVVWPSWLAALSPGLDLTIYGLCFALYWRFERLLDGLPDRGWSVSRDRRFARLEVGRRGQAGWLSVVTVVLSVCIILMFAADRGFGTILLVAALWLGLHRVRAQEVWGYLTVSLWGFAVAGLFYLMLPQYAVDDRVMNMLLLLEFGAALAGFAFINHREFVRHVGLRGE